MSPFRLAFVALRQALRRAEGRLDLLWAGASFFAALASLGIGLAIGVAGAAGWPGATLLFVGTAGPILLQRWRRSRRGPEDDAAAIDRRFGLGELMVTALEVDRRPLPRGVELALLGDASATARRLRQGPLLGGAPRRAGELVAALALLAGGTWLLALVRPLDSLAPFPPLGRLSLAGSGGGAGSGGMGEGPGLLPGSAAAGAAGGLAGSLSDHGAGREIAEALAMGDPQQAAAAARRLADRADQLSPAGRRSLSEALRQAARQLAEPQAELRSALDAAALALGGQALADKASLERMADQLARLSEAPESEILLQPRVATPGSSLYAPGGSGDAASSAAQAGSGTGGTPAARRLPPAAGPASPLLLPAATVQPVFEQDAFSPGPWSGAGGWAPGP